MLSCHPIQFALNRQATQHVMHMHCQGIPKSLRVIDTASSTHEQHYCCHPQPATCCSQVRYKMPQLHTRWPGPPSDETHNITVATTKWPLACNSQARRKQEPHQWPSQPRACYSQARQTPTEPPQPRGFKPATVRRDKRQDCCKCQSYSQACYSQARHPSCDG